MAETISGNPVRGGDPYRVFIDNGSDSPAQVSAEVTATIDVGDPITGQALEAGGTGLLGWLSSLRKAITDRLPAALGTGGGLKVDGSGTALPVSVAAGGDAAEGNTTDAAASSTVAEDTTARTGIGLWKGIKNILILLNAKFVAGTVIGAVQIDQTTPGTTNKVVASVASGGIASGAIASGAVASGAVASGAIAAGAVAAGAVVSGAVLSGAFATGAITDLPAKGQAAMAASVPVTIASDQSAVKTSDAGPSWTSVHGVSAAPFTSADQHSSAASVTDAPTSGQKLVITDLLVSVDTAMSVTFKCETSAAIITGPYYMPANSSLQLTPRGKAWKLASADKKLQVLTSVAGNVMVDAVYYSEA